jgi:hypothetical protein
MNEKKPRQRDLTKKLGRPFKPTSKPTKVLLVLEAHPEGITIGEIASELRISNAYVRHCLTELKKRGAVQNKPVLWVLVDAEKIPRVPPPPEPVYDDFGELVEPEPPKPKRVMPPRPKQVKAYKPPKAIETQTSEEVESAKALLRGAMVTPSVRAVFDPTEEPTACVPVIGLEQEPVFGSDERAIRELEGFELPSQTPQDLPTSESESPDDTLDSNDGWTE